MCVCFLGGGGGAPLGARRRCANSVVQHDSNCCIDTRGTKCLSTPKKDVEVYSKVG
eukprot:jgi/Botrbrau1/11938/Bobra.341_1s0005.1